MSASTSSWALENQVFAELEPMVAMTTAATIGLANLVEAVVKAVEKRAPALAGTPKKELIAAVACRLVERSPADSRTKEVYKQGARTLAERYTSVAAPAVAVSPITPPVPEPAPTTPTAPVPEAAPPVAPATPSAPAQEPGRAVVPQPTPPETTLAPLPSQEPSAPVTPSPPSAPEAVPAPATGYLSSCQVM